MSQIKLIRTKSTGTKLTESKTEVCGNLRNFNANKLIYTDLDQSDREKTDSD